MRIFRQKTVTGVDSLYIGDLRSAYYAGDIQITLSTIGRAYADRFIGKLQIRGVPVRLGINGHHFDTKLATGTDYPKRYLAAISYKNS
jgi:hypothetical protein